MSTNANPNIQEIQAACLTAFAVCCISREFRSWLFGTVIKTCVAFVWDTLIAILGFCYELAAGLFLTALLGYGFFCLCRAALLALWAYLSRLAQEALASLAEQPTPCSTPAPGTAAVSTEGASPTLVQATKTSRALSKPKVRPPTAVPAKSQLALVANPASLPSPITHAELSERPIRFPVGMTALTESAFLDQLRTELCKSLKKIVPLMRTVVDDSEKIARERCATQAVVNTNLTFSEALAVALYTYDLRQLSKKTDHSDNFYFAINAMLREGAPAKMKALLPFLWHLRKALDKLPRHELRGYRGLPRTAVGDLQQYKVGSIVHWNGVTSVSASRKVAEAFADGCGSGGAVLTIEVVSGRCVRHFSALPMEDEFLLEPGTKLVVSGCTHKDASGRVNIPLVEVNSTTKITF